MKFTDILPLTPVNRMAAIVTSQGGCEGGPSFVHVDVVAQIDRLQRKRKLLKQVLGVKNRCDHKNLMARFNQRGRDPMRVRTKPSRALAEYVRLGVDIRRLQAQIEESGWTKIPAQAAGGEGRIRTDGTV